MRIAAQIISVFFHPLLIIIYLLLLLIALNPYLFALQDVHEKTTFFVYTFVNALIIPIVAILIMKLLGMVKSLEMKTAKERIGPLIVISALYLWMFINFKGNPAVPEIFVSFILGSIFALFLSFFINNFSKVSLHMVGCGGLIMTLILIRQQLNFENLFIDFFGLFNAVISVDFLLILSILISGLVASSRLYLKAHIPQDIYGGFFIGILSQLIAYKIIF